MRVTVASAGTGKTTSLVKRYLELLQQGMPLRRIAGVTYTHNAADELRLRVGEAIRILQQQGSYLDAPITLPPEALQHTLAEAERELAGAILSTIHGFMMQCLRLCAPRLGLDPAFTILGEWQADAIFEEEWLSLLYLAQEPEHALHTARQVIQQHSNDEGLSIGLSLFQKRSLARSYQPDGKLSQHWLQVYEAAVARFRQRLGSSLLSPAEIERRALELSQQGLDRIVHRYPVVLIDEFQDVNPLQGAFFAALEQAGIQIEVVGDPKQSIYAFRNAEVEVFRRAQAAASQVDSLMMSYRHSAVITQFLNRLTHHLAINQQGFDASAVAEVTSARQHNASSSDADPSHAQRVRGRLELHWVVDGDGIANLRHCEARILAERLKAIHDDPMQPYQAEDMAVLARSYAGLSIIEAALHEVGLSAVLKQGRGYFERLEIRDLYHALQVGIDPTGLSLAAFLRSPFCGLDTEAIDAVLRARDPLECLATQQPDVFTRLRTIQQQVTRAPLDVLKFLIRAPIIAGKRYVDSLSPRQRDNVDALLFTLVDSPPHDLEMTLERLERLSRQRDAGDVPQTGQGVSLVTIHGSKGLEWPLVAVYDMGRGMWSAPSAVRMQPNDGKVSVKGEPHFAKIGAHSKQRLQQEDYRLLYVAVSRAADVLLLSGSVNENYGASPWIQAIWKMGDQPLDGSSPYHTASLVIQRYPYTPSPLAPAPTLPATTLPAAPWLTTAFPPAPYPPVVSPSYLKQQTYQQDSTEPDEELLPLRDLNDAQRLPKHSTTVGILLHYAISQNWQADNPQEMENLRAQELMFPFSPSEQDVILQEIQALLHNYQQMMTDGSLHPLASREEDYPELAMALPEHLSGARIVLQGIIDRLYRVGTQWYLEDYKSDKEVAPERYTLQMAIYLQAIHNVLGIVPEPRLVYLRSQQVVRLEPEQLSAQLSGLHANP